MPGKKFSVEQIVATLREAEKLQGQGMTIPQLCKRLQISDQTFSRWRLIAVTAGAAREGDRVNLRSLKRFCDGPPQHGLNVPASGYARALHDVPTGHRDARTSSTTR